MVFVVDTFETDHFARAIEEFPEIKEDLKNFIYYPDTTGISTYTYLSMATLMSGEIFPLGEGYFGGLRTTFEETDFFGKMHDKGFEVNYYTDLRFFETEYSKMIENLDSTESSSTYEVTKSVSEQLYKLSMFKYMPHHLKKEFFIDTGSFNETEGKAEYPVYILDDLKFNDKILNEGFKKDKDKKQYNMYHLAGLHAPIRFDRNLRPARFNDDVSYNDRRYENALGQIKILKNFIEELKKDGLYDNTTIVYTSDHGNVNRFNTVFAVKPANYHEEFKVSNAPISVTEDLFPFILETADGKGLEASLYKIPENSKRERYVYNFYSNSGYSGTNNIKTTIAVNGFAGDPASYKIIKDDYTKIDDSKRDYSLGKKIKFAYDDKYAKVYGFREEGWTWSNSAIMEIEFDNTPKSDIVGKISVDTVIGENQRLKIKCGGEVLFEEEIHFSTEEVSFLVLTSCFDGDSLKLEFEFPDTTRNTDDIQGLEWMFYEAFQFGGVTFNMA